MRGGAARQQSSDFAMLCACAENPVRVRVGHVIKLEICSISVLL